MRLATPLLLLAPIALLAGCGGGNDTSTNGVTAPSGPVSSVPPPAGKSWTEVVSATPEGGYRMGNPDAPIKLIEYGSRTCPVCGAFGREGMQPLEQKYVSTGKVSYEFREFLVHGQPDIAPALIGRCGGAEPFFPMLEAMYQGQEAVEQKMISEPAKALSQRTQSMTPIEAGKAWGEFLGYPEFARQHGLPADKVNACLNDAKELDRITQVMQDASNNKNVGGTPTFFLNGNQLNNVLSWQQLEPALKAAGA
jgi:protein-disulfide isomerase